MKYEHKTNYHGRIKGRYRFACYMLAVIALLTATGCGKADDSSPTWQTFDTNLSISKKR